MTDDELTALETLAARATPGPWSWMGNTKTHTMHLATTHSGHVYVMDFVRWGMSSAQPRFQRDHRMVPASDLVEYQVDYRRDISRVDHPDASYIAAANPAAVRELISEVRRERTRVERIMAINRVACDELDELRAKLAVVDEYYAAREAYNRAVDDGGTLIDKAVVADCAAERMDAAWRAK